MHYLFWGRKKSYENIDCGPLAFFGNDPSFLLPTRLPGLQGSSTLSDFPAVETSALMCPGNSRELEGENKIAQAQALEKATPPELPPPPLPRAAVVGSVRVKVYLPANYWLSLTLFSCPKPPRLNWNYLHWGNIQSFQPGSPSLWNQCTLDNHNTPIVRALRSRCVESQQWLQSWHGMAAVVLKIGAGKWNNGGLEMSFSLYIWISTFTPSGNLKPPQNCVPGVSSRHVCNIRVF